MSLSQLLKLKKDVTIRGDVLAGDVTLVVRVERGKTHCIELSEPPSRADCVRLVGLLLAQACRDGASLVRLGYDAETQQTWLRYELHSHPGQSWEMVPIPADVYAQFAAAVVSLCRFGPGAERCGAFRLQLNGRKYRIEVEIVDWWELRFRPVVESG